MSVRAWSYTTPPFPSTLALVDITPPQKLASTQVLVEVAAAALNPVDVQLANASIFKLPALSYPKGIGMDFSGQVIARGASAEFAIGDEVFGLSMAPLGKPMSGALTQVLLVDSKTAPVLLKPSSISFVQAAALPLVFLTATTLLSPPYTLLPPPSDPPTRPVIVVLGGSSGVGVMAVQIAVKKLNARVIATCSGKNAEFVKDLGAEVVIDYTTESVPERLVALRPPEGYLSIIDCVGGTELLHHPSYASLFMPRSSTFKPGGGFFTIVGDKTNRGILGGAVANLWNPRQLLRTLCGWWGSAPRYSCIDLRTEKKLLREVLGLLEKGLKVPIDSEWEFAEVEKAYGKLNSGRARGKVVVAVRAP